MKRLAILDIDGVLLDYREAYRIKCCSFFKKEPAIKDINAFMCHEYFDIPTLSGQDLEDFHSHNYEDFWRSMPPMPNVIRAVHGLSFLGYNMIAVSAAPIDSSKFRYHNLINLGFLIDDVICVGEGSPNPKKDIINKLNPEIFIEDHLPYLEGINEHIKLGYIGSGEKHKLNVDYIGNDLGEIVLQMIEKELK